jgi:hypothetical protein
MTRYSVFLLLVASVANAQEQPTRTVVKLDVPAKSAPKPALRYQLLPEVRELQRGTALQLYLKCFMEQNHFYHSKESEENRNKWMEMPLKDLPVEKLRDYGGRPLRFADAAARMERIEWQIREDILRDGVHVLLSDVVKMRTLSHALKVRLRGEIADKRFDDAIGTLKTLFKMAQQLGEHPTLIGHLIGLAIVGQTIPCIEEMIAQPGCPNLYWAFADLPAPLVSLRAGSQGERMFFLHELAQLDRTAPASEANIEKTVAGYERLLRGVADKKAVKVRAYLEERTGKAKLVKEALQRVIDAGVKREVAEKMPATQIILLDEQFAFETRFDEEMKWVAQPYWRAEPKYADLEKQKGGMLVNLYPNVRRVHRAGVRVEQRLRMLQILEAIRLHAAANKGATPEKLDDIDVPVPVDPFTGKPFRYEVEKGKATLSGTAPRSEEKTAAFNIVYEIKIVK